MNASGNEDTVPASPPCAQPHVPKGDAHSSGDNNGSTQESNPELIEVSNGECPDDKVVKVEDDNEELGECKTKFGISAS